METHVGSFDAQGQPHDSFKGLLVPVVLDKHPSDIRRNLVREHGDVNWLICYIRRAIFREISIMEAGSAIIPEVETFHATASFYAVTREIKKLVLFNSVATSRTPITCHN